MSRYPQLRSAAIPALWAVQRHYGWCSPEGIRQAAAVMGVTPAYLESVASFYDLFATDAGRPPPGARLPQHLLLDARRRRAARGLLRGDRRRPHEADHHGATLARRRVLRQGLRVPGRLRHRADGLDRRALLRPARATTTPPRRSRRCAPAPSRCPTRSSPSAAAAGGPEPTPDPRLGGDRRCLRRGCSSATSTTRSWRRSRATARRGGYTALERAFRELEPDELLGTLEDSGLRGRGGAGFSMGKKGSFLPRGEMSKYLCCNADESEPGAFKDRELMKKNPHQLIEGVAIAALAVGAALRVHLHPRRVLGGRRHPRPRRRRGLRGRLPRRATCSTPGCRVELVVHRGAGAYICGEETALLDALEGKRGNPRLKPPFPAIQGLYGGPTLINNVETLSNVPHIVNNGADWFKSFGTEQSPGTKVVSVSGCVAAPGQLRGRARDPLAGADLRPRRRARPRAAG